MGSIHSVKGETHTGTFVMETFWYAHSLEALRPWLSGDEAGGTAAVQRQQLRLKIHYVAMTRPYRTNKRAEWMEPLRLNRPQLGYPTDFVLSLILGLASLLRFAANSATTAFSSFSTSTR